MRRPRTLLLAAILSTSAANARADEALLAGVSAGGTVAAGRGERAAASFKAGLGLDWLHAGGLVLVSRLEATHERELALALGAGWWAEGLRTNEGLPLGATFGAALVLDTETRLLAGPRAQLALGLWYARALLELDVAVLHAVERIYADEPTGVRVTVGLTLRIVPWSPLRL